MPDRTRLIGVAAFFLVAASLSVSAAGDPERGAILADTCMGCHGISDYRNGYPSYRVPKLAGQHEDYMREVMMQYKNQTRTDPVMQGQAQILTDEGIADLAAFYAAQPGLFTVQYTR